MNNTDSTHSTGSTNDPDSMESMEDVESVGHAESHNGARLEVTNSQPEVFLSFLPAELRLEIYGQMLGSPKDRYHTMCCASEPCTHLGLKLLQNHDYAPIHAIFRRSRPGLPTYEPLKHLLRTNKKTYQEVLPVIFGNVEIDFCMDFCSHEQMAGPRMTYLSPLESGIRGLGHAFHSRTSPGQEAWLLRQLRHIEVVNLHIDAPCQLAMSEESPIKVTFDYYVGWFHHVRRFVKIMNKAASLKKVNVVYSVVRPTWGQHVPDITREPKMNILAPFEALKDSIELDLKVEITVHRGDTGFLTELHQDPGFKFYVFKERLIDDWNAMSVTDPNDPNYIDPNRDQFDWFEVLYPKNSDAGTYLNQLRGDLGLRSVIFPETLRPKRPDLWYEILEWVRSVLPGLYTNTIAPEKRDASRELGEMLRRLWVAEWQGDGVAFFAAKKEIVAAYRRETERNIRLLGESLARLTPPDL